jgi:hypothetical protein
MDFLYTNIEEPNFFNKLSPKQQSIVMEYKQALNEHKCYLSEQELSIIFAVCPYCRSTLLKVIQKNTAVPLWCNFCGDTYPCIKLIKNIQKVNYLLQIAVKSIDKEKDATKPISVLKEHVFKETNRVLLEQCIVILATSLEIYLKDVYAITLNLRYVKDGENLSTRFYNDCKNKFVNFERASDLFNKELNINFNELKIFKNKKDNLVKLNMLTLKRNVIVHNAGIADSTFIKQSGFDFPKGQEIPITPVEIIEYSSIIDNLGFQINEIVEHELLKEKIAKLQSSIEENIDNLKK